MKKDFSYYLSLMLGLVIGNLIGMWIVDSYKHLPNKEVRFVHDTIEVHDTIRFAK